MLSLLETQKLYLAVNAHTVCFFLIMSLKCTSKSDPEQLKYWGNVRRLGLHPGSCGIAYRAPRISVAGWKKAGVFGPKTAASLWQNPKYATAQMLYCSSVRSSSALRASALSIFRCVPYFCFRLWATIINCLFLKSNLRIRQMPTR